MRRGSISTTLLLVAVLGYWAARAHAAQYFVDSRSGLDSNAGTSRATPWRSLGRLSAPGVALKAGDEVLLARGSAWREGLSITSGGNLSHPLVFSNYGSRDEPKPMLIGSRAAGGAANWSQVPGKPDQWCTYPAEFINAPNVTESLHNRGFDAGSAFWGIWNENPQGDSHVTGSIDGQKVPPPTSNVSKSFGVHFRDMNSAPTSYTQLFTTNISIVAGSKYRLSFWAIASVDLNVSEIALFAMAPPYSLYAATAGPVLLKATSGWKQYSVVFVATVNANQAAGNQGRVTWLFANSEAHAGQATGGLPDKADVWLAGASLKQVILANPERVYFDTVRDVGNLLFFTQAESTHISEPDQTGWKHWSTEGMNSDGDYHFDRYSQILTVFCSKGSPDKCWPGGIEAALDITQIELNNVQNVVIDGIALKYGAAHGINGESVNSVVIRQCDVSWVGGGVLSYDFRSTGKPVRYGNGIQFWNGAKNIEVHNNRLWQIYDTPLTNQGSDCTSTVAHDAAELCAMRNISFHHNLAANAGMACVEIWYTDANTSMSTIRFENNLCANIGNGAWSAAQRPDPAGRAICFYHNTANTSDVYVRNNVLFQTMGFESLLYLSDHWSLWADEALQFDHNALFKTIVIPPPPPPHANSLDEHDDYVKLIGASPMHIHTHKEFLQFIRDHGGSGSHSIFVDPQISGLCARNGSVASVASISNSSLYPGSPLKGKGANVIWTRDFHGKQILHGRASIGPFQ